MNSDAAVGTPCTTFVNSKHHMLCAVLHRQRRVRHTSARCCKSHATTRITAVPLGPLPLPPSPFAAGDWTGSLAPSRTGAAVTFACHAIPAQTGLGSAMWRSAVYPRLVAVIRQDGSVATDEGCVSCYDGPNQGYMTALLDDVSTPNRYYQSGNVNSPGGGVRSFLAGNRTTIPLFTGGTWRYMFAYENAMYITYSGSTPAQGVTQVRQNGCE